MDSIFLIVIPLCLLILLLASESWIEPLIYLSVIGVSIALNMGTNIFFGSISNITHSMASVLQLAISMDYSLFLLHRYKEERSGGEEVGEAIVNATHKTVSSISASALTTIAGFLSLLFMSYRLGADIGLVLAKGIVLSFVCVIILLPIAIYLLHGLIEKTAHKSFIPSFGKLGRAVIKMRFLLIPLLILVMVPAFLAQKNNAFIYGESSASSGQGTVSSDRQKIEDTFGLYNPVVLLVPNTSVPDEVALVGDLKALPYVRDVQGLVTLADPQIPREFLPEAATESFLSEHYSRLIVLLSVDGETPETFVAVNGVEAAAQAYYPDEWLAAGSATSIADIKSSIESDRLYVTPVFHFDGGADHSVHLPLHFSSGHSGCGDRDFYLDQYERAVFQGQSLVFIGYLVVSSLQLGATIDYAILLGNRYMEFRKTQVPKTAAVSAINTAGTTLTVSALILTVPDMPSEWFPASPPSVRSEYF